MRVTCPAPMRSSSRIRCTHAPRTRRCCDSFLYQRLKGGACGAASGAPRRRALPSGGSPALPAPSRSDRVRRSVVLSGRRPGDGGTVFFAPDCPSRGPRRAALPGVASRWLRQPRPGSHSPGSWRLREGRGRPATGTSAAERSFSASGEAASSSSTSRPVRAAQAQVRADSERTIASSQAANEKLPAAATRNSAANPAAFAVKEPPMSVTAPRPAKTIPAAMRTRAKALRWRYSHGAIRRLIPDRGGVPQRHQVVVEPGGVLSLCAFIGILPVSCGVGYPAT